MIDGKTRLSEWGTSTAIVIPADIVKDSAFPFSAEDLLMVQVVGDTLVVSKV